MIVLSIDCDIDYSLIGIHSAEKAYRLAFLLNRELSIKMQKSDFCGKDKKSRQKKMYQLFECDDEDNHISYALLKNKYISKEKVTVGFFEEELPRLGYVIPERKKIDYFLKIIDCESFLLENILGKINNVREIQASYLVDADKLKSKNNLIF